MEPYKIVGVMSGTSLDGLDIAYCTFLKTDGRWVFSIVNATTIPYSAEWRTRLAKAPELNGFDLSLLDIEYGDYIGLQVYKFINSKQIIPQLIASHGHTVFHRPEKRLTLQIGKGSHIAAATGCDVITDFRSNDVALHGQGAPLVPIGDQLLFASYDYCLNLGGFANISYQADGARLAFDICPANIVLNDLSSKICQEYDEYGRSAESGSIDQQLFQELNSLPYYEKKAPKSLGREWVLDIVHPILERYDISVEDKLRTFCEHIAFQISNSMHSGKNVLVTGGGAWNKFLMCRISDLFGGEVIIPDSNIINYKEALIFAFLGLRRYRNEINCLNSVTGALRCSSGGAIYLGSNLNSD